MEFESIAWDDRGLVATVAQDAETGQVRMLAYANREALERTLATREAHFFSRSRQSLWKKGESSGNTMAVREVWLDCDGDTVLYLVDPAGPSCHTGAEACFFRRLEDDGTVTETPAAPASPTLLRLERTLRERRQSSAGKSYTKALLAAGPPKIGAKIREEAAELAQAIEAESDDRVSSEAGDVLYHLLVGLVARDLPMRTLLSTLSKRFGQSGHAEKASRPT
ncbi:MAG: bifunctional phosphoribosyl-AMP cyclohydrolase/phosphoribosyl-ATP diphosphatase HisIE [Myxococcota bacterium]